MKRTLILLCFAVFAFFSAKAQQYTPFPDSAAEWTIYYVGTCVTGGIPDTSITKYWLNGDTVINGKTYRKLGNNGGFMMDVVALREDDKKIYTNPTQFSNDSLLYDFNIAKGDSFNIGGSPIKSVVDSVDSIQTGNSYSRRFHFNNHLYGNVGEYWIEGIGSIYGLITDLIPIPTCGFHHYELLCFKQNGIVKYLSPNFDNCESTKPKSITAIKETEKYAALKIFPNPTLSKQFHIDHVDAYEGLQARVTDYTGKVVLTQKLNDANNIIQLPNTISLYILRIVNKQGEVVLSQKILNQ